MPTFEDEGVSVALKGDDDSSSEDDDEDIDWVNLKGSGDPHLMNKIRKWVWSGTDFEALEQISEDAANLINEGVPTDAQAKAVAGNPGWWKHILAGTVSPSFITGQMVAQFNNMSVIAVLLAGFSIGFAIAPPEFAGEYSAQHHLHANVVSALYATYLACMLMSGIFSFISTVIAMHAVASLSNSYPSKTGTCYLLLKMAYPARAECRNNLLWSMYAMTGGLVAATVLNFSVFYGVPAMAVAAVLVGAFVRKHHQWEFLAGRENDIGGALACNDIAMAAANKTSMKEGLLS